MAKELSVSEEIEALAKKHKCDVEDIVWNEKYKGVDRRVKLRRYVDKDLQGEFGLEK